jgi:predicted nucleic acid-binding protein
MAETFVVDCSVAAKWVLPDAGRAPALEWLERYFAGDVILIAPDMLLVEFASLISKLHRRKLISPVVAYEGYEFIERCLPRLHETRPRLARALLLSLEYHLSLWDCVYLVLSEEYNCPLLTADVRLFRGAQGRHPSIQLVH